MKLMKKGSLLVFGLLSLGSCESVRPKTPRTYGGAESEGLHEKGPHTLRRAALETTRQAGRNSRSS